MSTAPANGLPSYQVSAGLGVTHRPGSIRLDGFPLLVHAPATWGEGVRTEDNGTSIGDILAASGLILPDCEALARRFGTSARHVRQALAYAIRNEE